VILRERGKSNIMLIELRTLSQMSNGVQCVGKKSMTRYAL